MALVCSIPDMDALKRRQRDLDAHLQSLSRELRRAKQRSGWFEKMHLRESQKSTVRALVALHGGEPTAAIQYIKSMQRSRSTLGAADLAAIEAHLREWWSGADPVTMHKYSILDDTNRKMHSSIRRAQRFLVDLDLEAWVDEQNVQRGITPAPAVVLREAAAAKRRRGVEVPHRHRSSRRWLQRWRTRCGLRLRRFKAHEVLPAAELRKKAEHRRDQNPSRPEPPLCRTDRAAFGGAMAPPNF